MPKQCVSPFLMDELLRGQLLRPYIIFPGGPATGVSPTSCQDLLNRYWGEEPKKKKYKRKKKKKKSVPAQSWALVCFLPLALAKKAILASCEL